MQGINEVLEWLAVAVDLTGALIMVWAFVAAVVAYFLNKEIQEVSADPAQPDNSG
jgi:uncharacterized membrane protein